MYILVQELLGNASDQRVLLLCQREVAPDPVKGADEQVRPPSSYGVAATSFGSTGDVLQQLVNTRQSVCALGTQLQSQVRRRSNELEHEASDNRKTVN